MTPRPSTWPDGGRGEYHIVLACDENDGGWIAECVDLPGCMSQGETKAEALLNLCDAISGVLVQERAAKATEAGGS